mgnify:CR=1 FL=1
MKWKSVSILCLLLIVPLVAVWLVQGRNIYTKDKVQVVTKRVNPTFGVEEEIIEWKPQFRLGLEYGAPAAALCLAVGVVCVRISRSQKQ